MNRPWSRAPLPHDVLRLVFEQAASEDRRIAAKLALVSKCVQRWVDWILYAEVNLHRRSTSRAFLRTIETSKTKATEFFATRVKTLSISYDNDNHLTAKIISVCRGIISLTLWVIPSGGRKPLSPLHHDFRTALGTLRPRRLSVLLHDVLGCPHPQFQMPFFENITHLAVVNRWEEWVTWTGFELLPRLTHLSFDIRIGPRGLTRTMSRTIARATESLLRKCDRLMVCALLLIFDARPSRTVARIVKAMAEFDPRLVFLKEVEPFKGREAHSMREKAVWIYALETVERQKLGFSE